MGYDISKIHYDVRIIEDLCRQIGTKSPRKHQLELIHKIKAYQEEAGPDSWLFPYYENLRSSLEAGNILTEIYDDKNKKTAF